MIPRLTKTVTRMVKVNNGRTYTSMEEDGDRAHFLVIDEYVFEDFGSPEVITVTIEPGDKLNEEEA